MPRTTLLIADDVGLGKTIEAGLVVQELLLRHRARTALVVCPAALQVQWRDEMREKFGLEFRIVDRALLGRAAPLARRPGEPVHALPAPDRVDRLAQGRPRDAAAARGAAAASRDPAPLRHADRRRGPQLRARRRRRPLRARTRCAPRRSARSRRTASTGCSCRPRRTTATTTRSRRCSSCSTRTASRAASARRRRRRARSRSGGSSRSSRTPTARRASPGARSSCSRSSTRPRSAPSTRTSPPTAPRARSACTATAPQTLAADFVVTLLKKRLFSSPAAFLRTLEVHRETLQRAADAGAAAARRAGAHLRGRRAGRRRGARRGGRRRRHAGGARGRRDAPSRAARRRRSSRCWTA